MKILLIKLTAPTDKDILGKVEGNMHANQTQTKTSPSLVQIMLSCLFLGLVLIAPRVAWGTVLGDLAATMAPGTWIKLNTTGFTGTLLADGCCYHILQYTDDAVWNPKNREILFAGSGHQSPGKFIRYSESTNAWDQLPYPSYLGACHAYDHNAINPSTGEFFTRHCATTHFYKFSAGAWSQLPDASLSYTQIAGAVEFFPELGGLVFVSNEMGTTLGSVHLLNLSTNKWSLLGQNLAMGAYHNFAEYSPSAKAVVFGGGNDSRNVYLLDSSGKIRAMQDAPFNLGIAWGSVFTVDPVSGRFLVIIPGNRFYEYSAATDSWQQLPTPPVDFSPSDVAGVIATPISTYGVTFFARYNDGNPDTWIYKHSPTPPRDIVPPATPTGLKVN